MQLKTILNQVEYFKSFVYGRARWAKRLSWQEVACVFRTPWENVFRSVKHAVWWGLAHRQLDGIQAIGVDEIQWQRGHRDLTWVYQIESEKVPTIKVISATLAHQT